MINYISVGISLFIFFTSVLLLYSGFAKKTGFSILTGADGKSRFKSLNDFFKSSTQDGEEGFWAKWWNEKKKEPMFWLITTLILAYIAYTLFGKMLGVADAALARALIVLFGFHLVWWLLSKDKSWVTPVIVYGIGAYFVLASFQKDSTETIRDSSLGLASKGYSKIASTLKNLNSDEKPKETEQSAVAQAVVTSVQLTIPVEETVFVSPPQGYRLSSALCPPENVMEIRGSNEEVLQRIDCANKITLEEAGLYGKKFAFFQKQGATQPSAVIVRWVIIM